MKHALLLASLLVATAAHGQGSLTIDNVGLRNTYRIRFDVVDTRTRTVRGSLEIFGDDDGRRTAHTKLPFTGSIRPADDGSELLTLSGELFAAFSPPAKGQNEVQGRLLGRLEPNPGLILDLWTLDNRTGEWVKGPMEFGDVPSGPDADALLAETTIGGIRLGMPEATLRERIKAPMFRSEKTFQGATGDWIMEVMAPALGLKMQVNSATQEAAGQVSAITISEGSPLSTERGIGIGSTREDVESAYGDAYNPEDSRTSPPEQFVAGSVYGGIIFSLNRGRVTEIFVGAAAE